MLFYQDDRVSIYNGDVLKRDIFSADSFDLTVTSPPYNVRI